ncbi:MAG TPA: M3 family oligoendopeptidase [Solirubrobacteraceae bacterium]|nr:M3 family oligoendopeptidase [Solirubrobacteraceae bacterium]
MASVEPTAQQGGDELDALRWELGELVDGRGAEGAESALQEALAGARAFAQRYRGRVAELDRDELLEAMRALAEVLELAGGAGAYAVLDFSADTSDPARGALLARAQEQQTALQTELLFFELEWAALPEERVSELLAGGEELDFCAHHLRSLRRYRDHLLSEAEERIIAEKELSGASAWGRLFEELVSAIEVPLPRGAEQERVALDRALAELHSPLPEVRRQTAAAVSAALAPGLRTRAFIFNTLLLDKAVEDRLRRYPSWLSARNLANEVSDEAVAALLAAVRSRYDIPQRWYRLKARLLGVETLHDYDRMAALGEDEQRIEFEQAKELVLESYSAFAPELGRIAAELFAARHIDVPVRQGKRGGAFAAAAVPSVAPYVLLNYTHRRRDVLTLAHELGHALHYALAAPQGIFHQHTPLTLSETASVFGETIVFGRLLREDHDPASRLALLAENLEDRIATVFRQVAMSRFEELVHCERRERGEISVDRFAELWRESQAEMLGDSVTLTEGYGSWWSYIPHFIETPGYVYAYAFGQLLALAIYERYEERGEELVPRYLELLAAGGSRPPEELAAIVGVDLSDPGFWSAGLSLIERQLADAEAAALAAGG